MTVHSLRNTLGLIGLIVALPLLQLVPLPFDIWRNLPGRAIAAEILATAGVPERMRPLSLDPELTVGSALELLPGIAGFVCALNLGRSERRRTIAAIVAMAAASAMLGCLQRATGPGTWLTPFGSTHDAFAPGFFVNRNHQATLLLIAIALVGALVRTSPARSSRRGPGAMWLLALVALLLGAGVVATTSRMGLALLAPACLAALAIAGITPRSARQWLAASVAVAIGALGILQTSGVALVLGRFGEEIDGRAIFATRSWVAAMDFWPVGSGLGAFPRVLPLFELRGQIGPAFVNNAHNEYLELAVETGIFGMAGLVAFGVWLTARGLRLLAARGMETAPAEVAAAVAIVIVLAHSVVDYPLRMAGLMAVFGVLCGIIAASSAGRDAGGAR